MSACHAVIGAVALASERKTHPTETCNDSIFSLLLGLVAC